MSDELLDADGLLDDDEPELELDLLDDDELELELLDVQQHSIPAGNGCDIWSHSGYG